jgi:hypothetical protein
MCEKLIFFLAWCILAFVVGGIMHCVNWLLVKGVIWIVYNFFFASLKFWVVYGAIWIGEFVSLVILKK